MEEEEKLEQENEQWKNLDKAEDILLSKAELKLVKIKALVEDRLQGLRSAFKVNDYDFCKAILKVIKENE